MAGLFTEVNIAKSSKATINTEIEKNNCFTIYTRSDLDKIREETIKNEV